VSNPLRRPHYDTRSKLEVNQTTGLLDHLYEYRSNIVDLNGGDLVNIYEPTPKDSYQIKHLRIYPKLAKYMSSQEYNDLMKYISDKLLEVADSSDLKI
jgi:hypothetical protein